MQVDSTGLIHLFGAEQVPLTTLGHLLSFDTAGLYQPETGRPELKEAALRAMEAVGAAAVLESKLCGAAWASFVAAQTALKILRETNGCDDVEKIRRIKAEVVAQVPSGEWSAKQVRPFAPGWPALP